MPYEFAPWIRPPDNLGAAFTGGVNAGAEIAHQQAALAQQANLATMEATLKQQQLSREHALEQQRLEIQKAYQNQEMSLRKQELQQAQQINQIKVQQAAKTFAARQQYQQWLSEGKDPVEGILKLFPGTDESMTGYGQLARQWIQDRKPVPPPSVENVDVEGQQTPFLKIPERGGDYRMQQIRVPGSDTEGRQLRMSKVHNLERLASSLQKQIAASPGAVLIGKDKLSDAQRSFLDQYKSLQSKLDSINQRLEALYSGEDDPGETADTSAPAAAHAPAGNKGFRILAIDGVPVK